MPQIFSTVPNHRRQILIVDDEPDNLLFLRAILKPQGYQVREAYDGQEAVEAVDESLPDLVVMDVTMPVLDGFDACKIIKERHKVDFVPVILLTGHADADSQVKGLDAGADEYLVKPPRKEEFLARVRAMLRIRDLQHQMHVFNNELQRSNEALKEARDELERGNKALQEAQHRIAEELRLVGEIQQSFLPGTFPKHSELEFACYYHPSSSAGAGGDYYDAIEVGRNRYGLVIADVTGHGAPAAVIMAITHTLMTQMVNTFKHPSTALKVLNEKLYEHLNPTYYVTMFYGILDHTTFKMSFCSAGHDPMYLYRAATHSVEELVTKKGFPLKLVETDEYDEKTVTIEPGDQLVLFTDGLIEVRGHDRSLYGPERLRESILEHGSKSVEGLTQGILEGVRAFAPQEAFRDDVSLMTVRRIPEEEQVASD